MKRTRPAGDGVKWFEGLVAKQGKTILLVNAMAEVESSVMFELLLRINVRVLSSLKWSLFHRVSLFYIVVIGVLEPRGFGLRQQQRL
jgi:hypothetical protein